MTAEERHQVAYHAARKHAAKCRRCAMPIIKDDEGNPGLFSEACAVGMVLLREYVNAERALFASCPA